MNTKIRTKSSRNLIASAILMAVAMATPAFAGGNGVQVTNVAAGAAAMARNGAITTIITSTPRTIINYSSLSLSAGETLKFAQPTANSSVLNRIDSSTPSVIDGTLLSNGQVYLVNPAGVMFGAHAVVNVGGLVAAAGHISDADYLAGNMNFTNNTGAVENDGIIQASQVHLVGLNVANFGTIIATPDPATGAGGVVTMTAGNDVYIAQTRSPTGESSVLVKVSADKTATHDGTGVTNAGKVDAGTGSLHMGAGDIYAAGIYNSGTLKGKAITLDSGANTNVSTGTIDATNNAGKGGDVAMVGEKVGVFGGTVDASGSAGGGNVIIGGDPHNVAGGANLAVADMAVVAEGAAVHADGTGAGAKGGNLVVFSNSYTGIGGELTTLNGPGGAGGFIETSGLAGLVVDRVPNAGNGGTWLIDPRNVSITLAGPTAGVTGTFTANADNAIIKVGDLLTALNSGDVIISTGVTGAQAGTVNWVSGADMAYNFTGNTIRTLTINANGTIDFEANVSKTGGGNDGLNLVLNSTTGDVIIGGSFATHGGSFQSTGANFTLTGTIDTTTSSSAGGNATLNHSGAVALNGTFTVSTGGILAITAGSISQTTGVTASALAVVATGNVNLSTANAVSSFAVVDSGSGQGVTFVGTGNISFGSAGLVTSSSTNNGALVVEATSKLTVGANVSTSGGNLTLIGNDIDVSASLAAGAGAINFQALTNTETFGLGAAGGQNITLTQAEIGAVTSAGSVNIGLAGGGGQSGNITVKTLDLHGANAPFVINTTGTVNLDNNNASPALATGLGITINAGVITAQNATNAHADIASNGGAGAVITLNATTTIGTSTNRISIGGFNGTTETGFAGSVAVNAAGNVFLNGIGGLSFSSITNTGNSIDVTAAGDINATGTLAGSAVTLNATGGIGLAANVTINASTSISLTTSGAAAAGNINIAVPAGALPSLTIATDAGTVQTETVTSTGGLALGNAISAPTSDTLIIHTGTAGSGNISFSAAFAIAADNLELWAGNGTGSAKVDFSANAPTIHNSANNGRPNSLIIRQDGSIADADILPAAQFDHGIAHFYTLESDVGGVTLATAANVAGVDLTLNGATGETISTTLSQENFHAVNNAVVTGNITTTVNAIAFDANLDLTGNLNANTNLTVTGTTIIRANTTISSAAGGNVTLTGLVSSQANMNWALVTSTSATTTFGRGISTTAGSQLGALDVNGAGTTNIGNGTGALTVSVMENAGLNASADGHISITGPLSLMDNTTFSVTTTAGVGTLGNGVGDVALNAVSSTSNNDFTLTVNTPGVTWLKGSLGGAVNGQLGGVSVNAVPMGGLHEQTKLGNDASGFAITLGSPATFGDAVLLQDNTTITAPGGTGNVTFGQTVDSETSKRWTLVVTAGGTTSFGGTVGGAANGELGALTLNGAGNATLGNGGSMAINTKEDTTTNPGATGIQSIDMPITIQANLTFSAAAVDPVVAPNTNVTLGQLSATAGQSVTVNTGGVTWFKGGANATPGAQLSSITTDAGGSTQFGSGGATSVVTTVSQTYNDAVNLQGNTLFKSPTLAFNGSPVSINAGTFDLTVQSDGATFAGGADSVEGSGNLTLLPTQVTDAILIGTASVASNTLAISNASLLSFKDGFASITIGGASESGPITISTDSVASPPVPVTFTDPVTIQSPNGSIHLVSPDPTTAAAIYGDGNAAITLHASSILMDASVQTNGNAINIQGNITLGSPALIQLRSFGTTNVLSANGPTGGPINITGNVNDDGSPTEFVINADFTGTLANVKLLGNVGNTTPPLDFAVAAAEFRTGGDIRVSGSGAILEFAATTIALAGNIDGTTVSSFTWDTDNSGGTADAGQLIFLSPSPINLVPGTGPVNLTIDTSATGGHAGQAIALSSVGNTTPLRNLTLIAGNSTVSVADVTLTGAFASSGTTFANAGAIASTGATINHTGAVSISNPITSPGGAVSITGDSINTSAQITGLTVALVDTTGTTINASVTGTNGVTSSGGSFFNLNSGGITTTNADVTITHASGLASVSAAIQAGNGAVAITSDGLTSTAAIASGPLTIQAGAGAVALSGQVTSTTINITGTGITTTSGGVLEGTNITLVAGSGDVLLGDLVSGTGLFSSSGVNFTSNFSIGADGATINHTGAVHINAPLSSAGFAVAITGNSILDATTSDISGSTVHFTSTTTNDIRSTVAATGGFTASGTTFTISAAGAINAGGTGVSISGTTVNVQGPIAAGATAVGITGGPITTSGLGTINGGAITLNSGSFATGINANVTGSGLFSITAGGPVTINAHVLATGGFSSTGSGASIFTIAATEFVHTQGGNVTISHPGGLVTLNGPIDAGAGDVSITSLGFTEAAAIGINGHDVSINATTGAATINGPLAATGAASITGTGITIDPTALVSGTSVTFDGGTGDVTTGPVNTSGLFSSSGAAFTNGGAITADGVTIDHTGAVNINNDINSAGFAVSISGTSINIATGVTISGQTMIFTDTLGLTLDSVINAPGGFTSTGTGNFILTSNGAINTTNSPITIDRTAGAVSLSGPLAAGTGEIDITGVGISSATVGATIGGGIITLDAGTGDLAFAGAITGSGLFTSSGHAFTNTAAISAHGATLNQTGPVEIGSPLDSTGFAVSISGTTITVDTAADIHGTTVGFTDTAGVSIDAAIDATGGFTSTGTGNFALTANGAINTTGSNVTITRTAGAVTLTGPIAAGAGNVHITSVGITTNAGGTIGGGSVTLAAGTVAVSLSDAVTATSALSITGAGITTTGASATLGGTAITLASGSGNTTLGGAVTGTGLFSSTGAAFTSTMPIAAHGATLNETGAININNTLDSTGFAVSITGSSIGVGTGADIHGTTVGFTDTSNASIDSTITATGGFTSNGPGSFALTVNGAINTGGSDVTITRSAGLVTLTGPIAAGAGNVHITSVGLTTNSGATFGGGPVTLNAGTGAVSLADAVNASGALSITGVGITTGASATLGGTAITLAAGTGNTTLGAAVTGTGLFTSAGAAFTSTAAIAAHGATLNETGTVNINSTLDSTGFAVSITGTSIGVGTGADIHGTTVGFTDTSVASIDATITATGGFTSTGTGNFALTGNGAINTGGADVTITRTAGAVTLTGPIAAGAGNVHITSVGLTTNAGATIGGGVVTLGAGAGAVSLSDAVNASGALSITGVGITTGASATLNGTAITLAAGAGNVTLNAAVTGTGLFTSSGAAFTNNAAVSGSGITLNQTGLATLSANLTAGSGAGAVHITSAGATEGGGVVIHADSLALSGTGAFSFTGPNSLNILASNAAGALTLTNSKALSVGTASAINGLHTSGGNLTLHLTSGDLTIANAVSAGAITFTAAHTSTGSVASTSSWTVNGSLDTANAITIPGNVSISGNATLNAALTSTGGAVFINGSASGTGAVAAGGSIHVVGGYTLAGSSAATTTFTVDGDLTVNTGATLASGTAMTLGGNVNLAGNLHAGSTINVAGTANINGSIVAGSSATFNSNLTFSGNATAGGTFSVAGNAALSGNITAPLIEIPNAVALTGNVTLSDDAGIVLGTVGGVAGNHDLTLISNDPTATITLGAVGTAANPIGNLLVESANLLILKGDIYANTVAFNDNVIGGSRAVPDAATIISDTAALADHTLIIDTAGTFAMELNQKFTVHDTSGAAGSIGNLTIQTVGSEITLSDISVLGKLTVSVGTDFNIHIILLDRPPTHNLLPDGTVDPNLDKGMDIVAGFNGPGAINFRGTIVVDNGSALDRVQFASVAASDDIASKPGILGYVVGSNLDVVPVNIPAGSVLKESDFVTPTGTVLDLVANGISGTSPTATQGTVIPRDVQTLQPERGQAISGALRDALRELGIYARDLTSDEILNYLVGRALYDDVPYKLDPGPTDTTVAANRLPYTPVIPTVDAYRHLFFKQEVDDKGNPVMENGKPKMVPQDNVILTSLGQSWNAFVKDSPDDVKPAGFRAYLEAHEKDDPKLATALDYLNQLRDLLAMIKSLGLTANEFEVSKKVLLAKVRPGNIKEEDFPEAVDGPSSRTTGVAVK